jgi:hypothetical protein
VGRGATADRLPDERRAGAERERATQAHLVDQTGREQHLVRGGTAEDEDLLDGVVHPADLALDGQHLGSSARAGQYPSCSRNSREPGRGRDDRNRGSRAA